MRVSHVEGTGAVCFDAAGRVSMVVHDDLADLFDQAERQGMTADDVLNRMLDQAEAEKRHACRSRNRAEITHLVPQHLRRTRRRMAS